MDQDSAQKAKLIIERIEKIFDRIEKRLTEFEMRLKLLEGEMNQGAASSRLWAEYRVPVIVPTDTMKSISQPTWEILPRY